MVIPFAGSIEWYRHWLAARLAGDVDEAACLKASRILNIGGKDAHRTIIDGRDKPLLLSVPIQKGSTLISDHGNWTRIHLGALNAQYGRAPFFPFIFPDIADAYSLIESQIVNGVDIIALNRELHLIASQWIDVDAVRLALDLAQRDADRKLTFSDIANNISTNLNSNLSIFHLIFRYGKNSIFALIDWNDTQL